MAIADLSKYQGTIDFSKLKNQVDFVILRVQAGYTSIDPLYKTYVAGCKANGIPFGTYAYFKGISVPDSLAEAKSAYSLMDPDSKFFVLDIEEVTNNDLVGTGQAFIDYLKNQGVQKVGLYSGESFFNAHNLGNIKANFTWIAKYGNNDGLQHSKPAVTCDLWQYTSVGHLDGIAGNVDLNMLTGSKPLDYFTGQTAATVSQPQSPAVIGRVKVIANNLNIRAGSGTNFPIVGKAVTGQIYNVYANINDWHNIGINQWVFGNNGQYLSLVRDNPQPASKPAPAAVVPYPGRLIKQGVSDPANVKRVQNAVGVKADGVFGPATEKAVKAYQSRHGLAPDGIIGPATWNVMF